MESWTIGIVDELEVHHLIGKWARVKAFEGREEWGYARNISATLSSWWNAGQKLKSSFL